MKMLRRVLPGVLAMALLPFANGVGVAQATTSKSAQADAQAQSKALAAANSGGKIDINTASMAQLKELSGIGDAYAQRIVKGRPYANKAQLATRGVLPQGVYDKVKAQLVATQPK